jgi:hypothetical protein
MPYGYGSSNRERGADRNRSQTTSKSKGISASKTTSRPNPHTSSGSSNTTVATGNQIRASKAKVTAAVGKSQLDNYKVKSIPVTGPVSLVANIFLGTKTRQKMFERNRKFYREKVLKSKNRAGYVDTLESYKSYMNNRLSGKTDAYGNPNPGYKNNRGNNQSIQQKVLKEVEAENKSMEPKKTEVKQSLFKKSGNRSGMIGRSVNNRRISAYRRFLLNEEN